MSESHGSAQANEKEENAMGNEGKKGEASFDLNEIRELAEMVDEFGFTQFEFENENIKVSFGKAVQMAQPAPVYMPQPAAAIHQSTAPAAAEDAKPADPDADLHKITSPIVGTFYRSPGPDKEPYVKEGSSVSSDSVVCIVEAMKLMNEIQAEISGEIVKIYVENGQPVEYGQPLFGIKK